MLFTGNALPSDIQFFISNGADQVLLKPVDIDSLEAALKDPRLLDDQSDASVSHSDAEQTAACWISDSLLLVAGGEAFDDEPSRGPGPTPNGILIYDVRARVAVRNLQLDRPAGAMMMAGANAVVTFHGFPRLVSLTDGAVLRE